jgi:aromatic ring hydroxylase-like protein
VSNTLYEFRQSTVPGCRTPHLWLLDGRSLYDALGPEFTLLRFDPKVDTGGLVAAAAQCGVSMVVLDVESGESESLYPRKLVLSRPDQHVAWRGDAPPRFPGLDRPCSRFAPVGRRSQAARRRRLRTFPANCGRIGRTPKMQPAIPTCDSFLCSG